MKQEKIPTLGFVVTVAIAAMLVAPVLYVLSAGPGVFLLDKRIIGEEGFVFAFGPLEFVLDYIPESAENLFEQYINWWGALAESTGP